MFIPWTWIAMAALAVLLGGGGFIGGCSYEHDRGVAALLKAAEKQEEANTRANHIAADYESFKANQRPKTITITKEVERVVQADAGCSKQPLPDGLRDALTRLANPDKPVADGPMSSASSAAPFDLGRPGHGLRGPVERTDGLPGTSPGTL